MDDSHNYEMFVRYAFSYALKEDIGRGEDPAELANTDIFYEDNINSIKSVIGYCMNIYNKDIIEKISTDNIEIERVTDFIKKIIESDTLSNISVILDDYENTVKDKYFNHSQGIITLK